MLKTIKQLKNIKNKTVLVRVDYNVLIKDGQVLDTEKLERSFSTINYLLKHNARIVLMSHLGRPGGKRNEKYSLRPVVKYLNKITKKKVFFVDDCIGDNVKNRVAKLKAGQILLLNNLRFYKEEENNDIEFAKELASLADIYVNSAFAVCHRNHASVVAITKYLPAYAGLNLKDEINHLEKALKGFKKPAIAIIGGVKISTKIKVIERLLKKYNYVLLGGALANNFFVSQKINIGKSLYEKEFVSLASKLYKKYKNKIVLPVDVRITKNLKSKKNITALSLYELDRYKNKNFQIIDIGPKTEIFFEGLIKQSKTLIWNGPLGLFEIDSFAHGTNYIAQRFAMHSKGPAYGIIGGGETVAELEKLNIKKWPDFISTGGGAMLKFLEGGILPGIKPLIRK